MQAGLNRRAAQIVGRKSARPVRLDAGKISLDENSAVRLPRNRNIVAAFRRWTNERDERREIRIIENRLGTERQIFVGEIHIRRNCLRLSFKINRQVGVKLLILCFADESDFADGIAVDKNISRRAVEIYIVSFCVGNRADGFGGQIYNAADVGQARRVRNKRANSRQ